MQMRSKRSFLAAFAAVSALLPLSGCVESERRDRDEHRVERYEERRESYDPKVGPSDRNVPRGSQEIAAGKSRVRANISERGRIFLTDSEYDAVIWAAYVQRGDEVELDAKEDRIYFNHKEVARAKLKNDILYRIYFKSDRR